MKRNTLLFFFSHHNPPRHKVYLLPYQIANREVTCREYLEFMSDDGYMRPELWLSEGWESVEQSRWQAPLYWELDSSDETGWRVFTLKGWHGLSELIDTPVCHVSFFEANAFARWRGCRLPTEAEWESVSSQVLPHGNLLDTQETQRLLMREKDALLAQQRETTKKLAAAQKA